jgi:predicted NBD/HSP70 family sugar kinase
MLLIRSGRANSRSGIAELLGISPATAGDHVSRLIDHGYLRETGLEKIRQGRPKRTLALHADAGWFAGVEFYESRVRAVRLDFSGAVVETHLRKLPPRVTTQTILREVSAAIKRMADDAAGPLMAIGVGAAGIVDPERGIGVECTAIPDWRDVPVVAELRGQFDVPVTLDNHLRAFAYAERWFGGGRHLDDYVILGPMSGFGVAIVSAGRVLSGVHHAAGEIGLWPRGRKQLQDVLSPLAVWRRLAAVASDRERPANLRQSLVEAATCHPRRLVAVVDEFANIIGRLHLLLDTEAYFLHGPLTALGAAFCTHISDRARRLAPALGRHPPSIIPSTLGDDAGAIGAGCKAMEEWTPAAC